MGGVQGVLALDERGWVVENDSEVRLWEALSGERGARTRLLALAAVLDAGLAPGRLLSRVNSRLSAIAGVDDPDKVCLVPVAGELLGPVAYACACLEDEWSWRWLAWALSARLDANLLRGVMWGPGWQSMHCRRHDRGFDRDTHWMSEMPQSFWDRLSAHPEQQLRMVALASDPTARRGVLKDLAHQPAAGNEVWDLVASNPRTPNKALAHLARRFQGSYTHGRVAWRVAQNRRAGPDLLSQLADSPSSELRSLAAAHPAVPGLVLEMLAGDDDCFVRMWVAQHSSTPVPTLRRLAADEILRVRMWVASNASTPRDVLEMLLGDRYAAARLHAVANPNTPTHVVETRAADRAITVRRAVADRAQSVEVLLALAEDPHGSVRAHVASNETAPEAVLESLAKDQSEWVRAAVAGHPNTPAGALAALAADTDEWIRFCVASNPKTKAGLLAVLAVDEDSLVRCGVAKNAAALARLLKKLAADADEDVRFCVAQQAAAPSELLEMLAGDESWSVRGSVARNEQASEDLLAMLAQDIDLHVRGSVCNNPSTPERVVDALRHDADYWVRAQAAAAIEKRRELKDTPQRY